MVYSASGAGERTYVLVHGIGMGRITFDGVAETLGAHARVLTVDLPGFGDSPRSKQADSMVENADLIGRFITSVAGSNPVMLVGHSMGTQIVTETAIRNPDLVSGLVLIAPTINRRERTAVQQAARMAQDMWGESLKVFAIGAMEYFKTQPLWFFDRLRRMLSHRLEARMTLVTVPTLVLRGEHDRVAPRDWTQEIANRTARSQLLEIPDRGHEAVIKSPEPVASMLKQFGDGLER